MAIEVYTSVGELPGTFAATIWDGDESIDLFAPGLYGANGLFESIMVVLCEKNDCTVEFYFNHKD